MDKKIQGAWIIHHADKLQNVKNAANDYEALNFAGKCGLLLSSLAASESQTISRNRLEALAKPIDINRITELPTILDELEKQKLIICDSSQVSILGLTTATTLEHTTNIFHEYNPDQYEIAAIDLAEKVSELPLDQQIAKEYIGDNYKIDTRNTEKFLTASNQIGFVDIESVDSSKKLLFNGNLFRRDEARKISTICSSLSESDIREMKEIDEILNSRGCIPINLSYKILGEHLFKKLQSIGLYEVNTVTNERGKFHFVTKPSAFSKFGNPAVEDAFDLAKTFVTSLTFGMIQSQPERGRITMIHALMKKLINGEEVGPATAIGQDYKVLELRGVIRVRKLKQDSGMFFMKLLKKDIGELALKVITSGDISTEAILSLPGASVTDYIGPEQNRTYERKHQSPRIKHSIVDLLDCLRTGL